MKVRIGGSSARARMTGVKDLKGLSPATQER